MALVHRIVDLSKADIRFSILLSVSTSSCPGVGWVVGMGFIGGDTEDGLAFAVTPTFWVRSCSVVKLFGNGGANVSVEATSDCKILEARAGFEHSNRRGPDRVAEQAGATSGKWWDRADLNRQTSISGRVAWKRPGKKSKSDLSITNRLATDELWGKSSEGKFQTSHSPFVLSVPPPPI